MESWCKNEIWIAGRAKRVREFLEFARYDGTAGVFDLRRFLPAGELPAYISGWCRDNWETGGNARHARYGTSTIQGDDLTAWVQFETSVSAPQWVVPAASRQFPDLDVGLVSWTLEPHSNSDVCVRCRGGVETDDETEGDLPLRVRVIDSGADVPLVSIAKLAGFNLERDGRPNHRREFIDDCRTDAVTAWLSRQEYVGPPTGKPFPDTLEITRRAADLGLCPECTRGGRCFELATARWGVCDTHRVRWCVERGLSPNRNVPVLPDCWLDAQHFGEYREVSPVRILDDLSLE